ncbi:hypothetical protein ES708_25463 [subsurface metagenome]
MFFVYSDWHGQVFKDIKDILKANRFMLPNNKLKLQ